MFYTITAAIIPVVFILFIIYKIDTEKEPISLLIKCFVAGMLIVLPIIFMERYLHNYGKSILADGFYLNFYTAFAVAGFSEEFFKFLVAQYILRKTKYFDQFYDGIVFAVFVSMGFALVENILYVTEYGMKTAVIRGLISVPAHAFFGIFMGYHLSLWRVGIKKYRFSNLILAILIPVTIHGLFDFFLMDISHRSVDQPHFVLIYIISFFALNIWFWRTAYKRIRYLISKDKSELL